jgi:hypothetical protein
MVTLVVVHAVDIAEFGRAGFDERSVSISRRRLVDRCKVVLARAFHVAVRQILLVLRVPFE